LNASFRAEDFQGLLTTTLAGLTASSGTDSVVSSDSLLAPLMLQLLEKLLAQQLTPAADMHAEPRGLPVEGRRTQDAHPGHMAIDLAVPVGTPVKATMSGTVVYAGWNNEGYGNLVIVENGPYRTYYAHLSKIPMTVGQSVPPGMVIGLSGNTGNSTGPHLHYEVRVNGQQVDPSTYLY
jgi:murein DD-endopeptidase MepM/ murein hydrolase activator NlpD